MEGLFAEEACWGGGYYGLNINLGPQARERVSAALEALWADPKLDGRLGFSAVMRRVKGGAG